VVRADFPFFISHFSFSICKPRLNSPQTDGTTTLKPQQVQRIARHVWLNEK